MRCLSRHLPRRRAVGPCGVQGRSEAADPAWGRAAHCIRAGRHARRKGERGSAILESFLAMILLGFILFGILQLFQLALADMVADYAAFRGARSAAVGFKDYYAIREAQIKAAPASGAMVTPDLGRYSSWNSVETEKSLLRGFMEGNRYVEYAYWGGKDRFHTNYLCPYYGEPMIGRCDDCSEGRHPELDFKVNGFDQTIHFDFEFVHYPLDIPLHDWLTGRDSINISSEAELTNHSSAFLE
ncbi:MAG: pilus assembly protein [Lentisphaeria bacterium]|nr:pilus assembly protein [Lentisphaeria bacterium]